MAKATTLSRTDFTRSKKEKREKKNAQHFSFRIIEAQAIIFNQLFFFTEEGRGI